MYITYSTNQTNVLTPSRVYTIKFARRRVSYFLTFFSPNTHTHTHKKKFYREREMNALFFALKTEQRKRG